MSGVVDDAGVQWERCNCCSRWIKFSALGYQQPNTKHPHGRDLCVTCVDTGIKDGSINFDEIQPAAAWRTYEVTS